MEFNKNPNQQSVVTLVGLLTVVQHNWNYHFDCLEPVDERVEYEDALKRSKKGSDTTKKAERSISEDRYGTPVNHKNKNE